MVAQGTQPKTVNTTTPNSADRKRNTGDKRSHLLDGEAAPRHSHTDEEDEIVRGRHKREVMAGHCRRCGAVLRTLKRMFPHLHFHPLHSCLASRTSALNTISPQHHHHNLSLRSVSHGTVVSQSESGSSAQMRRRRTSVVICMMPRQTLPTLFQACSMWPT